MNKANIVIAAQDLVVFAGTNKLLGPITFSLEKGNTLVIMGETGAGKSLLAQAILGTLPKGLTAEGIVHLNGERIDQLTTEQRSSFWGREVAILPQEPWRALDPLMRAHSQVHESHRYVAGLSAKAAKQATTNDFQTLELSGAEKRLPNALSGGMAQRVAFAAATAADAQILIADEPTKGLDADRSNTVIDLLTNVPRKNGALLAITHEAHVARRLGGDVLVLKSGNLIESGNTQQVLEQPSADYTQQLLAAEPKAWPSTPAVAVGAVLLDVKNISVNRGNRTLLEGFSLLLRENERVAIAGPSGVGKTSLLDVLSGLIRPSAGKVTRSERLGTTAIQKLYQDPPAAFPSHITLGKSLRDVARLHGEKWSTVLGYLSRLGINEALLNRRPDAVSGGELQRISIARALTAKPAILLADEPTSRLDPITQRETLSMIADIAADKAIAVVLVTHDLVIAEKWADRSIKLS